MEELIFIGEKKGNLIVRADAGEKIGAGHIMRCLALAETWKEGGGKVIFVLATSAPLLEHRLSSEGMDIRHIPSVPGSPADARDTVRIAQGHEAEWIVVDGYHFGSEYQKIIGNSGISLLSLDDNGHADQYYANIVLNQNIYADMSLYKKYEPHTRFLLGTEYVLLRKEFLEWNDYDRTFPAIARNVLVTMGGSDPDNITSFVIESLKKVSIPDLEVIAVTGSLNPHHEILQKMVKDLPNFLLKENVTTMPELMAWADVAISAAGSTCWELAFMGVPAMIYPTAETQSANAEFLNRAGITRDIGKSYPDEIETAHIITHCLESRDVRKEMSQISQKAVDGKGTQRVVNALTGYSKSKKVLIKK
jgi:UDP-2,4-diacetamido-2,4,6-trideoxy-beta-L-altropyranose hydrolase